MFSFALPRLFHLQCVCVCRGEGGWYSATLVPSFFSYQQNTNVTRNQQIDATKLAPPTPTHKIKHLIYRNNLFFISLTFSRSQSHYAFLSFPCISEQTCIIHWLACGVCSCLRLFWCFQQWYLHETISLLLRICIRKFVEIWNRWRKRSKIKKLLIRRVNFLSSCLACVTYSIHFSFLFSF